MAKTRDELVQDVIDFLKEEESFYNQIIEELDSYNGYLGDDRYYEMYELDEFLQHDDPLSILLMGFNGYDESYSTDGHHAPFNPNSEYFHFNGYGNLVSAWEKDYSAFLDKYFVENLLQYRNEVTECDELTELLDQIEEIDNEKE